MAKLVPILSWELCHSAPWYSCQCFFSLARAALYASIEWREFLNSTCMHPTIKAIQATYKWGYINLNSKKDLTFIKNMLMLTGHLSTTQPLTFSNVIKDRNISLNGFKGKFWKYDYKPFTRDDFMVFLVFFYKGSVLDFSLGWSVH